MLPLHHKQAQDNITFLNEVVWGTCNTSTEEGQCVANMGWFADTLEDVCSDDLKANNAVVMQTHNGACKCCSGVALVP